MQGKNLPSHWWCGRKYIVWPPHAKRLMQTELTERVKIVLSNAFM